MNGKQVAAIGLAVMAVGLTIGLYEQVSFEHTQECFLTREGIQLAQIGAITPNATQEIIHFWGNISSAYSTLWILERC